MEILEGNKLINEYLGDREINHPLYAPNIVNNSGLYHESWDWLMPAIEKFEMGGGNYHVQHSPEWHTCFVVWNDDQDRIFEYYSYHEYEPNKTKLQRYWEGITHYLLWKEKRKTNPEWVWSSRSSDNNK